MPLFTRFLLVAFFAATITPQLSYAQTLVRDSLANAGVQKNVPAIGAIQKEYNRIQSLPLRQEKYQYESAGCVEDGVVTYGLDKQTILKITESGAIGDGTWNVEYYYQSGHLIFCYEMLIGGPAAGKEERTAYRYYFQDDQVLRFMRDKVSIQPDSKVTETLARAYKLLKVYTTKNFAAELCE